MTKTFAFINMTGNKIDVNQVMEDIIIEFQAWGYSVSTNPNEYGQVDILLLNENLEEYQKEYSCIVIANETILSSDYHCTDSNELFHLQKDIAAIIILDKVELYKYEHLNFQFSPLKLIHIPSRHKPSNLISFLVNKYS
ncbi:hypothetical protein [Cytobacillus pseudoceanisediminis]|uniref:hypothetical protein n=1 Tax=Cytobacillus pseudoceanisediminis TaxID=3051614 RepID=UPI003C2D64DA